MNSDKYPTSVRNFNRIINRQLKPGWQCRPNNAAQTLGIWKGNELKFQVTYKIIIDDSLGAYAEVVRRLENEKARRHPDHIDHILH